jgi:hypothetical protein
MKTKLSNTKINTIVNAVETAIMHLNGNLYQERRLDQKRYGLSLEKYNGIFHSNHTDIKGQLKQSRADTGKKIGSMLEKYVVLELANSTDAIFAGASGYDMELYNTKWETKTTIIYNDSNIKAFSGNMHGIKTTDRWLFIGLKYDEVYSICTNYCVIIVNDKDIVNTKEMWTKSIQRNSDRQRNNNSFLQLKFLKEDFNNLNIYKGDKSKLTPTGKESTYVTFKPLGEIPNVKLYKK